MSGFANSMMSRVREMMDRLSSSATSWKDLAAAAEAVLKVDNDYFMAIQIINKAIDMYAASLGLESISMRDPKKFLDAARQQTGDAKVVSELVPLFLTRSEVLSNLGAHKRAKLELDAVISVAPDHERAKELRQETEEVMAMEGKSYSQQEDAKIPATVLTGFLGSGKTTLLNHILRDWKGDKRIAIIENEFGEVGIDDALVTKALKEEETIIEMNNGCICCTVRGDLVEGLKKILKSGRADGRVDHILIETTGLADPAPVAQTFFVDDYIQARIRLDGIVTVVDAKHIIQHLDDEKPEGVENEAIEQLAFSDRILLNKIDLVDAPYLSQVEERIRAINNFAPIVKTTLNVATNLESTINGILGIRAFSLDKVLDMDSEFLKDGQEHQHDESVTSIGIDLVGEVDEGKLNAWLGHILKNKGVDIFRMKGVLAVEGQDSKFVFQGIHMLFSGIPQDEWKPSETRSCKLVFIGRNLDRAEIEGGFRNCLVKRPHVAQ
ncbi:unnamed protein product [Vitrella brassicaformis CCMP3155]|uniref:CobW C-terminal domain-containing protein n=1 Tax=Vitrella brassicaformis (strain CCMP3155) TaxID=1169540 RepID=A0A0G4F4Z0_VITBC|nr:unnamed protein product [Vitrella brassicaformis CCMP3155]|eukprot:CEM06885.1 unnamed protein product [Vitrella brassicaformis CCMP3155]